MWGTPKGAALVRMADLLPTIQDRTQENILLEHIRKSHPEKRQPHIIDLTKDCPSPKEVQTSFLKLRELCAPDSTRLFKSQDFKFYGLLDSTKWMSHVSTCLAKAVEAADQIHDNFSTVVLQEGEFFEEIFNFLCGLHVLFRQRAGPQLCHIQFDPDHSGSPLPYQIRFPVPHPERLDCHGSPFRQ